MGHIFTLPTSANENFPLAMFEMPVLSYMRCPELALCPVCMVYPGGWQNITQSMHLLSCIVDWCLCATCQDMALGTNLIRDHRTRLARGCFFQGIDWSSSLAISLSPQINAGNLSRIDRPKPHGSASHMK